MVEDDKITKRLTLGIPFYQPSYQDHPLLCAFLLKNMTMQWLLLLLKPRDCITSAMTHLKCEN